MSSNHQFRNSNQFNYPYPSPYKFYFQYPMNQLIQNPYPYQQNFYQFSMTNPSPLYNQCMYQPYNPFNMTPNLVSQPLPEYGLPSSLLMKINEPKHQQQQKKKQNGNEKGPITIDLCSESENDKVECQNISKKVSTALENEVQNQEKKSLRKNEKKSYKTADYCISIQKSISPSKKFRKLRMLRLRKKQKKQKLGKKQKNKKKIDNCGIVTRKTKLIYKSYNVNKKKKTITTKHIQREEEIQQFIPLEIRIGQQYQCKIPDFINPKKFQNSLHEKIYNLKMREIVQDKF